MRASPIVCVPATWFRVTHDSVVMNDADGGLESADDEDAVEREVMRDRNAPRFGEQALQPLKARPVVLAVRPWLLLARFWALARVMEYLV